MSIDWWTLGLQTVNALVLIWILARFLFRPVSRILAERQEAAHAELDAAQAARAEAEAAREAAKAETASLAAARSDALARAQAEAAKERDRLIAEARTEAATLRDNAGHELARERDRQRHALSQEAGELAADIAARLMARLPETTRVAGFTEGLAEAVAGLPEATRARIGSEGPVILRAVRPLDPAESAELNAALARVLGTAPALTVETDPALIAGLELETPHAIVRNHLRADLDRIRAELTHD
ncbi:MAG: F0F1 ATP synthase subunit delta [Salipiger thiooxidans]|uniref:F0F1 ATP synthase subunit delta n=1 Tax=Salipiger thiooxidans TaxID=282683 RepID=UPI001CFC029F|nr:F0F1 ATP synthase subunit delta [Salipiger thiooxidans]